MSAYRIAVKRQESPQAPSWTQVFIQGDCASDMTVADFLRELNLREPLLDADGRPARPVAWECGCLQARCGACAMRICGRPALACSVTLEKAADGHGEILLEPLSRFPVAQDLKVDRSLMSENLKKMKVWVDRRDTSDFGHFHELQEAAAQCCQCGLCLEICPAFASGGGFAGAAAMVKAGKALDQNRRNEHFEEMAAAYRRHFFNGCCQSLSCVNVCPLRLPLDELQARANARAVWKKTY